MKVSLGTTYGISVTATNQMWTVAVSCLVSACLFDWAPVAVAAQAVPGGSAFHRSRIRHMVCLQLPQDKRTSLLYFPFYMLYIYNFRQAVDWPLWQHVLQCKGMPFYEYSVYHVCDCHKPPMDFQ